MKHSPGPWLTEWRRGYRVFVEYDDGDELGRDLIARVSGAEANARLIAAAPEMLEALKKAQIELGSWIGCGAPQWTTDVHNENVDCISGSPDCFRSNG